MFLNNRVITILIMLVTFFALVSILRYFKLYEGYRDDDDEDDCDYDYDYDEYDYDEDEINFYPQMIPMQYPPMMQQPIQIINQPKKHRRKPKRKPTTNSRVSEQSDMDIQTKVDILRT
jgi:hypothetical protein